MLFVFRCDCAGPRRTQHSVTSLSSATGLLHCHDARAWLSPRPWQLLLPLGALLVPAQFLVCFSLLFFFLIFPIFCGFLAFCSQKTGQLWTLSSIFPPKWVLSWSFSWPCCLRLRHLSLFSICHPKRGLRCVSGAPELGEFSSHQAQFLGHSRRSLSRTRYGLSHVHA